MPYSPKPQNAQVAHILPFQKRSEGNLALVWFFQSVDERRNRKIVYQSAVTKFQLNVFFHPLVRNQASQDQSLVQTDTSARDENNHLGSVIPASSCTLFNPLT